MKNKSCLRSSVISLEHAKKQYQAKFSNNYCHVLNVSGENDRWK